MKIKAISIGIILILALVVGVSGCVSSNTPQNTTTTQPQPSPNYTIITCPNPNCLLHDPNRSLTYKTTPRPIIVNTVYSDSGNYHVYLCQVCGAQWED